VGHGELPRAALEAAAHWYVQLNDETAGPADRVAWERWLAADAMHRLAWMRMQALESRLNGVPGDLAVPTLAAAQRRRRHTLEGLTLLLCAGTIGAWRLELEAGWASARADLRTATGERRRVELADGGTLDINTASAVDVDYGADLRLLRLLSGEILVRTAADPRPLEVHTEHGAIRALGTRFSVRREGRQTHVAVLEQAVEIRPNDGPVLRLEAGRQAVFAARGAAPASAISPGEGAWRDGKLIAVDRRLDDFLAELERHRPGKIACAPEVGSLRLSGAFRLHDTDAVLDNIAASLPIKLRYLTRYWVSVEQG
jgi:transmembrane sensor